MLPYQDALTIARQHLYSTQPPVGYVWRLRHGQRVGGGWFFWQHKQPIRFIKDPTVRFGGGPVGFTVTDGGSIQVHGLLSVPGGVSPDVQNGAPESSWPAHNMAILRDQLRSMAVAKKPSEVTKPMADQYTFVASEVGVASTLDCLVAALKSGDDAYVMLQRHPDFGSGDDDGVYVEIGDQVNANSGCVESCSVTETHFTLRLRTPLLGCHEVVAELSMPREQRKGFLYMLRRVFTGHESLLQIDSLS